MATKSPREKKLEEALQLERIKSKLYREVAVEALGRAAEAEAQGNFGDAAEASGLGTDEVDADAD